MSTVMKETRVAGAEIEFATFHVGPIHLGIDIHKTEEINRQLDLTAVPNGPRHVRGVTNLRGEVVTVLDLRSILGLDASVVGPLSRNLLVRTGHERVGLLVDRVADVVNAHADDIEAPPANVKSVDGRFFQGIIKLDGDLLVVLDVNAVLSTENWPA